MSIVVDFFLLRKCYVEMVYNYYKDIIYIERSMCAYLNLNKVGLDDLDIKVYAICTTA